jgi:MYXO-CTERM domain-containing protein
MKPKYISSTCAMSWVLALPAGADVIYSNLKDIPIPDGFAGVYLDVDTGLWNNNAKAPPDGWDMNPFFGGSVLWNSPGFQPVRIGTTETSAVRNLTVGTIVGIGSAFSTFTQGDLGENPGGPGYGISETHIGNGAGQFGAGAGYLGFRLNGNYGWMRVVFTNNSGVGQIREWAYDTSGAAIATGNILRNGSDVILDSTEGDFTVSSAITDIFGPVNLVKSGSGIATLTGANTYAGTTTVDEGTLLVNNASGSGTGTGDVSILSGATLGGTGSLGGTVNITGILSPGASIGTLNTGSLMFNHGAGFLYEINTSAATADLVNSTGNLEINGTVTLSLVDLGSNATLPVDTKFTLISYGGNWSAGDIFSGYADGSTFSALSNSWRIDYDDTTAGDNGGTQSKFVTLTVVPESGTFLLGGLGLLALLRRRRD